MAGNAQDLPFSDIEFRDDDESIAFMLDDVSWRCDLDGRYPPRAFVLQFETQ